MFPFEPILLLLRVSMNTSVNFVGYQVLTTSLLNSNYNNFVVQDNVGTTRGLYMKKSSDGKIISFYDAQNQQYQFNNFDHIYYYAAIGGYDYGGETEWLFTESQTWIVPKTGNYHLELYGNGGRSAYKDIYDSGSSRSGAATGGTSCQIYDSISLTKGSVVNIACYLYISGQNPRGSSFGSYSVAAGGVMGQLLTQPLQASLS